MSAEQQWDYSYDVVVVGSGNGGLTAALCSYEMGIKDVLVLNALNKVPRHLFVEEALQGQVAELRAAKAAAEAAAEEAEACNSHTSPFGH